MVTIRRLALAAGATVVLTLGAAAPAVANIGSVGHGPHFFRHPHHAPGALFGMVSAVNGTTTAGTCGVAGSAGSFTLTHKAMTDTVDVSTTTRFSDRGDPSPSFADVCVGDPAGAIGTLSGTTLTASGVFVPTPTPPPPTALFGTVSAVNGTTTAGTCGVAGSTGSFTLTHKTMTDTVDVSTTTRFSDRGDPSPSFADVCVGDPTGGIGTLSGTTLTASIVFVPGHQPGPHPFSHQGPKPGPSAGTEHVPDAAWNGDRGARLSSTPQPSWPSHSWGPADGHDASSGHQSGHGPR